MLLQSLEGPIMLWDSTDPFFNKVRLMSQIHLKSSFFQASKSKRK